MDRKVLEVSFLSLSFSDYLPTYLSIFYVSIYLSISLFLSFNYPIYLSIYLSIYFQKWSEHGVLCAFWLGNVLRATTAHTFSTSEPPKLVRSSGVFNILTSKCASRHNGVHFFDISTSNCGPNLVCFVHFDFETCFAPQRRAIFHLSSGQLAPHPPL